MLKISKIVTCIIVSIYKNKSLRSTTMIHNTQAHTSHTCMKMPNEMQKETVKRKSYDRRNEKKRQQQQQQEKNKYKKQSTYLLVHEVKRRNKNPLKIPAH